MPFLATEGILIDPAQRKLILPQPITLPRGVKDEEDSRENSTALELETGLEDRLEENSIVDAPLNPLICPKVKTTHKIVPRQPDLSWIKGLEEFDKLGSVQLQEYLAKFNGVMPSDPIGRDEYFTKLNEYFVKRYTDVFTESLPDSLPHPDSPPHHIILENESLSLNGRNYRIPTRYWSKLKEFIEIHLKAGRICPSSSHIASGTIILHKPLDSDGMP
jgi:hypothetical protein